jgi:hypothetical protein
VSLIYVALFPNVVQIGTMNKVLAAIVSLFLATEISVGLWKFQLNAFITAPIAVIIVPALVMIGIGALLSWSET